MGRARHISGRRSVALHALATVTSAGWPTWRPTGAGQLAHRTGSATGGNNKVASGILRDSASSGENQNRGSALSGVQPWYQRAAFRPAAGEAMAWWMTIQRGLRAGLHEQVGFG